MTDNKETTATELKVPEVASALPQELEKFAPQNFAEAVRFCEFLSRSDMVPKDYRGKSANIFIAFQFAMRLQMDLLQVMENVTVINGRSCIWGDLMWAIVKGDSRCANTEETLQGTGDKMVASCRVERRGHTPVTRTFSVEDAKVAGLWNKQGPWRQYPQRMLQMRARAWACRDSFPDKLKGLHVAEEIQDIIDAQGRPTDYPAGPVVDGNANAQAALSDKDTLVDAIRSAPTEAALTQLKERCQSAPEGEQEALRIAYKEKLATLRRPQGNRTDALLRKPDPANDELPDHALDEAPENDE